MIIGSCASTYLLSQVCYQISHIDEREKQKSHQRNAKAKGPAKLEDTGRYPKGNTCTSL